MCGKMGKKENQNFSKSQKRRLKKFEKENSKADLFSSKNTMEGIDSNAEILPAKKKNHNKGMNQVCHKIKTKENQNLSKSQKRKLKKLEEEQSKEVLFSKSSEMLEKYKISEYAYSLLQSSKNIGRAETTHKNHRRAIQFSKAGLVVPNEDESLKTSDGDESDDSYCMTNLQEHDTMSAEELPGEANNMHLQEVSTSVTPDASCHDVEESSKRADGIAKGTDVDAKRNSNFPCPLRLPHVTPCIVHVSRPSEVEEKRKDLPVVMMEQEIMEAINDNPTVIICGETGCGKTTQVPQFLYEAGFGSKQFRGRGGMIGVTQPRKVAVLSTAKRVAFELGFRLGKEVGFQVRHDKKIGENSSIKFMTDGILLREVQNDMFLRQYSVIILDEAHERSLNTDILIGMLTRVVKLRQSYYEKQHKILQSGERISPDNLIFPIRLVLMSATLRVEDLISGKRLFNESPPIVVVPTRQFPVTIHFSKETKVDYMGEAYKKVMSIHKNFPRGGILVFVTGYKEVEFLCRKLRKASRDLVARSSKRDSATGEDVTNNTLEVSYVEGVDIKEIGKAFDSSDEDTSEIDDYDDEESDEESEWETFDDNHNVNDYLVGALGEDRSLVSLKAAFETLAGKDGSNSDTKQDTLVTTTKESSQHPCSIENKEVEGKNINSGTLRVLPLYAMLPAEAQLRVFEEVKEGERLVVVATNVAETSLTIPGIKYVVDSGREKVKNYNPITGVEKYEIQWISKASAAQRTGRAGRIGPGHCYRLYSSAVFNNIFHDFSCAEISKVSVAGVVLILKSMHIDNVESFPFPTPPQERAIAEAKSCLKALEALDSKEKLTSLGKAMAYYPMSPRHSRMLLTVIQIMRVVKHYPRANLILGYAVATAAALSLSNPFIMQFEGNNTQKSNFGEDEITNNQEKQQKKKLKEKIKAVRQKFSNPSSDALTSAYALQCFERSKCPVNFCEENGLLLKTMEEMSELRKQLLQMVFRRNVNSNVDQDLEFSWPHGNVQEVESSWRVSSTENQLAQNEEDVLGQAICAGWADRVARKAKAIEYKTCMVQEPVYLHRWSSLFHSAPEYLVYSELVHTRKLYMHGATKIKPEWLVKFAKNLCTFSSSLTDPRPYYDAKEDKVYCWVTPSYRSWNLPMYNVPMSNDEHCVAVFACSLLEGHVLPCLMGVRNLMAAKPETLLKRDALGQKRVGNLLYKLKSKKIDSCVMLRKVWSEDSKALYSEIQDWFQKKFHHQFQEIWFKMLLEVQLEPQERFPKRIRK